MPFDPTIIDSISAEPGVYLMKNKQGIILYIGKAKNLKNRLKQYFLPYRDTRPMIPFLIKQIDTIDTMITPSEKEALILENNLIKQHQPKYNVLLKDDKSFIGLQMNHHHKWPMLQLVRWKDKMQKHTLHFGPYTSALAARRTLDLIHRLFRLRQCSDRELRSRQRPCLLYSIKRCLAPCVGYCDHDTYQKEVLHATQFLKGNSKEVIQTLKRDMTKASEELAFERAHEILQTIHQIEHVTQNKSSIMQQTQGDADVFGLYQQGKHTVIAKLTCRLGAVIQIDHFTFDELIGNEEEIWETFFWQHYANNIKPPKEICIPLILDYQETLETILTDKHHKKVKFTFPQKGNKHALLQLAKKNAHAHFKHHQDTYRSIEATLLDLQETCSLNRYPIHIDCFDTSNIGGQDLVACMVRLTQGQRDKSKTRLFKIEKAAYGDDYGALREALNRHYKKAKEKDELPDLILIDGGKGQLNVALDVLKELSIACVDVIALAKEEGRHDKGLNFEKIFLPYQKDPLFLSPHSSTLFMLQKLRDEAHEVAIAFQRKRRKKRLIRSQIDQIPGIGPKKKQALLLHFGSVQKIQCASKEDLKQVQGLSQKDIEAVYSFWKR